jgi:hypothetical protein
MTGPTNHSGEIAPSRVPPGASGPHQTQLGLYHAHGGLGSEIEGREHCRLVLVLHIRCGSSAAVDGPHGHVRFPPQSGPKRSIDVRPLSADFGA